VVMLSTPLWLRVIAEQTTKPAKDCSVTGHSHRFLLWI